MRIKDKIHMDRSAFIENGPITIVAFGDSITQGAFAKDDKMNGAVPASILMPSGDQIKLDLAKAKSIFTEG